VNRHLRSAHVWHVFSRDLTVLPAYQEWIWTGTVKIWSLWLFAVNLVVVCTPDAGFSARKAPENLGAKAPRGPAGELRRSPDSLAAKRGTGRRRKERIRGEGREREIGEGQGRERRKGWGL